MKSLAAIAGVCLLLAVPPAHAQETSELFSRRVSVAGATQAAAPTSGSARKFEITDNSFLVEEAFNQEARIFQNIASWTLSRDGAWNATFTQEWPLGGTAHQFSYTIPFSSGDGSTGIDDMLLNYRYQLWDETSGHPAVAPRVSVVLPTGHTAAGFGSRAAGVQINVPFSKQFRDLYVHWNAGLTWLPRVALSDADTPRASLTSPQIAASGIWRVTPMFNVMLEALVQFEESVEDGRRVVNEHTTIAPGSRRGWNIGDRQLVIGAAVPISMAESGRSAAALTYFSYELPFK